MTPEKPAQRDLNAEADAIASALRDTSVHDMMRLVQKRVTVGVAADGLTIRRNGPCPCGSGKKYKKCCMLTDQAQA